uniref:RBM6 n=1 Tax=Ascaris lumbricoides TaxID=6252 RepID=A0A0M3I6V9_ASCLU
GRLTVEATKRQRLASGRERVIPIEGPSRRGDNRGQQRSDSNSSLRERGRSESETRHSDTQGTFLYPVTLAKLSRILADYVNTKLIERRSPQTTHSSHTYYHESSRTGGGQGANQSQERTQYRGEERSGFDTREKREREYRSETRNEYRSESRDSHRDDYRQDGSLDRHRYRVDSPSTSTQQNGGGEAAKSESRSSVRSVQILRKTFQ